MKSLMKVHWLESVCILLIALFLCISPFYMGVFISYELHLEKYMHGAFIVTSILLILLSIYIYRVKLSRRSLVMIALAALLPISFVISSFFAVSQQEAIHSIYILTMFAVFFVAGYLLSSKQVPLNMLIWTILVAGYLMVFFSLSEWFGTNMVTNSVVSGRLSSPLLYANAYAAFLTALFFAVSYLTISSKNRFFILTGAFLTVPTLLSFLLTYSRGGYLVFVALYILCLVLMPINKQIKFIGYSIISAIYTGSIFTFVSDIGIDQQRSFEVGPYLLGLMIVLIASGSFMAIVYYLHRRIDARLESRRWKPIYRYLLPVLITGTICLLVILLTLTPLIRVLPESLQDRILSISFYEHSVLERITFYEDSMKIISDYPIFGTGGGGWNAVYKEYQSYPYLAKQPHSFILKYTIESGIFGLLLLLMFLFIVFYRFYKNRHEEGHHLRLVFLFFAVSVLIHSLIDFNMDFFFLSALVFLSLGVVSSSPSDVDAISVAKGKNASTTKLNPLARWMVPGISFVIAVCIFVFSSVSIYANNLYYSTINGLAVFWFIVEKLHYTNECSILITRTFIRRGVLWTSKILRVFCRAFPRPIARKYI